LGIILGPFIILALEYFWTEKELSIAIGVVMIILSLVMIFFITCLRNKYTQLSKYNLNLPGDHLAKYNAVEILSQSGHKDNVEILIQNLVKKESNHIRLKILKIFSRLCHPNTIPEILNCLDDPNPKIKLAALQALAQFQDLGQHIFTQAFSRHRVINILKKLFYNENSKAIRSIAIKVFANLHEAEIVPFLLKALNTKDENIQADCIYVCGFFHDISVVHYLEKYLYSDNPKIKSSTIIALWQFKEYRLKALSELNKMLESKDEKFLISAVYTLGEISLKQEKAKLLQYLQNENIDIHRHAAVALAKLKSAFSIEPIVKLILDSDEVIAQKTLKHLQRLPKEMQDKINKLLYQRLSHRINETIKNSQGKTFEDFEEKILKQLHRDYEMLSAYFEVAKIEKALEAKKNQLIPRFIVRRIFET